MLRLRARLGADAGREPLEESTTADQRVERLLRNLDGFVRRVLR
ncbi:hypothetical protein [Nocardioides sp. SYSU DS0651]